MRHLIGVGFFGLAVCLFAPATRAAAVTPAKLVDRAVVTPAATRVATVGQPGAIALDKPGTDNGKGGDEVKVPKDKPKKSKKNPNDDKDGDPDDGNAGGG